MAVAQSHDGPLRILHIFRAPVGGLFRYVLDVARGQIARGHEVGIVCDEDTGGVRAAVALTDLEPQLALGLHRIGIGRNPGPRDLSSLQKVHDICRRTKPQILHGHGSKGGLLARLPAFLDRNWPACVYTAHGGTFHFQTNRPRDCLYRGMERLLAQKTDLFLMESAYIERCVQENIGPLTRPVRIIYHGITDGEFEPVETVPEPVDLLFLGEMRRLKGVDVLLEAMAILRRDGMRLSALFVGAGPEEAEFFSMAGKLGLRADVSFEPPQPIRKALARGRIFVLPSRGESLSYVALEVTGAGIPMVATRVGGLPEIFGPYADQLVPPSDPAALAAAIRAMMTRTEDQRRAMAAELVTHVRTNFGYDRMVEGSLQAYREARAQWAKDRGRD